MPWDIKDKFARRKQFVLLSCGHCEINFSGLCRRFGISRNTGYKWRARFLRLGEPALGDKPRSKTRRSNQTPRDTEAALLALREKFPTWGPRKLRKKLSLSSPSNVPSASSVARILKREGLINPSRCAQSKPFIRFARERPNQLWQMDFKGDFPMLDGSRCHPLTILDDHSRFLVGLFACDNQKASTVQTHLLTAFTLHGLPECILCDNGPPWGNTGGGLHSSLGVWLLLLGVRIIHGRPFHPQTQGKDERFHRTLKADLLSRHDWPNLLLAQQRFNSFRDLYNHDRPHQALRLDTPSQHYHISPAPCPKTIAPPEYAPDEITRTVKAKGEFTFQNRSYYLGEAFRGLLVALRATSSPGLLRVCLGSNTLGCIDTLQSSCLQKGRYHKLCPYPPNHS